MNESYGTMGNGRVQVYVDHDLEDIIPRFFERRGEDVASILGGLEQGDYETIRYLGHSMKGAGGGYGFDAITEMGRDLERAAGNQDRDEILKLVGELSAYLELVEPVYG